MIKWCGQAAFVLHQYQSAASLLTIDITVFALVLGPEAVARNVVVVVDAAGPREAQVLPGVAFVATAFLHVFVLGRDEGRDGQQVGCRLAGAEDHVADAADK